MNFPKPDFKTFALQSALGRFGTAFGLLAKAAVARDPYNRACALLRAWRGTGYSLVANKTAAFLRNRLVVDGEPVELAQNSLLQSFVHSAQAREIRREFAQYPEEDRVRLRYPRPDGDARRQGDLIVLKPFEPGTSEKGVLLIKYNDAFFRFAALFDVERLVRKYMVVLEPSWWGYQDVVFFLFVGRHADVIVQAQARSDFEFLQRNGITLTPIRLGAGDWVDPELFQPSRGVPVYDVVMVSSWNPFKRHGDLFQALKTAREKYGHVFRAALIGYPSGLTANDIVEMAKEYGVLEQIEIFETIPQAQVAEIVSRSRLYVLLSRREGANKAMYEAMFCDTPVLAPAEHRGINHDHLNPETGSVFEDGRLAEAMIDALTGDHPRRARQWALENTGYVRATHRLNECLGELSAERGMSWNRSIVAKQNRPNLWFAAESDRHDMRVEYQRLRMYLRPTLVE